MVLLYINANVLKQLYGGNETDWVQYRAKISSGVEKIDLKAGQKTEFEVEINNEGTMTWISSGDHPIYLTYRMKNQTSEEYISEGKRTALPEAMRPGDSALVMVEIVAPSSAGNYLIVFDMVHEGITWFEEKGSMPLVIGLKVIK